MDALRARGDPDGHERTDVGLLVLDDLPDLVPLAAELGREAAQLGLGGYEDDSVAVGGRRPNGRGLPGGVDDDRREETRRQAGADDDVVLLDLWLPGAS